MTTKRVPTNTTAAVQKNPGATFAEAVFAGGAPAMIERQEATGQRELVVSAVLPANLGPTGEAVLAAAGVRFGALVDGDPLFRHADLPAGWKKAATDYSMWSSLLDDRGRERATIFYKAAFYDRDAFLRLSTRFRYSRDYQRPDYQTVYQMQVWDGPVIIWQTEAVPCPPYEQAAGRDQPYFTIPATYEAIAVAWLEERYPDWRNPAAYWGEPAVPVQPS